MKIKLFANGRIPALAGLASFILLSTIMNAQGTWTQKTNFGGSARYLAAGFSIGTKGYVGTGSDVAALPTDLWEWNQGTNAWTQKANFSGTGRAGGVGFSIGTKGYIGTGYNGGTNAYYSDLWEWNQGTNAWTQKASITSGTREHAVGFSIGTKGYIGTGMYSSGFTLMNRNDMWEWNQTANTWTQKANFPGAARRGATAFVVNNKAYVGCGEGATLYKDFYEFDPAANTWTTKASFGANKRHQVAFTCGSKGYIGAGTDSQLFGSADFWEYDPTLDTWVQMANCPGASRYFAVAFSVGGKGYVGTGTNYNVTYMNDFWEFAPVGSAVNEISLDEYFSVYPNPTTGNFSIKNSLQNISSCSIAVYNVSGEKVLEMDNVRSNTVKVDLGKESSGVYFLHVKTQEGVAVKKLIKK